MAKCKHCGKVAVVKRGNVPLCVDCNFKYVQAMQVEQAMNIGHLNFLLGTMEAQVGMPGILPRYEVPKPIIYQGAMSFSNIKVDNSVVGLINTGQVKQIDVAMNNIKNAGNEELVNSLKVFTEAVIAEKQMSAKLRDELIEQLSFISLQCALGKESRKPTIVKSVLKRIGEIVTTVKSLGPIWAKLLAVLQSIFD